MSSAPPEVIDRLRKIAGMLGSEHVGERAAAAAKANEILARYKLTWADVIAPPSGAPPPPPNSGFEQRRQPPPNSGFEQRRRPPPPPPEPDWMDADDDVKVPVDIPTEDFTDAQLRAASTRAVHEHKSGLYDLGGTDFLKDVGPMRHWSVKQRIGLVKTLRRAWVIRKHAGYR